MSTVLQGCFLDMRDTSSGWSAWKNVEPDVLARWIHRVSSHPEFYQLRLHVEYPAFESSVTGGALKEAALAQLAERLQAACILPLGDGRVVCAGEIDEVRQLVAGFKESAK